MKNVRLVIRGLLRTPLFTITAVASLALGIGANTAMFSMLDALLLRTLPVRNPGELVFLYHPGPLQGSSSTEEGGSPSFSYAQFRELQKESTAFAGLAGTRTQAASLSWRREATTGSMLLVSGNYFSLLGTGPAIGRVLTESDDGTPGAHPVAVLSYSYWERRLGANRGVLNDTINVNGQPLTIVGVAQKGFRGERPGSSPDLFVPISMRRALTPDFLGFDTRLDFWVAMFGRLRPGVALEQAATAINVLYRPQLEEDIAQFRNPNPEFLQRYRAKTVVLKPGKYGRGALRDQSRVPLLLLMGMTLLVLLIACANVANLQLARAAARTREVAVRLAVGATRWQLVRQFLIESGTLALAGGALGLIVCYWTLRAILASAPPRVAASDMITTAVDGRVLLFCVLLSLATGIVFGLYPAVHASGVDLLGSLRDQSGQATSTRGAGLFRKGLVVLQTAISLLLLISAGLFARTLVNLMKVDLGMRADHLMTFAIAPRLNGYADERLARFYADLTERLASLPGVTSVSAATVPAIANSTTSTTIIVEGYTPRDNADRQSNLNAVGAGYFSTLGIPLVAGREFRATDAASAPRVVIVNEAFVRHYFPDGQAIGRRIGRGQGQTLDTTIVGVVKDARYSSLREAPPRVFYRPYMQDTPGALSFYVRTAIEPERLGEAIRRELGALDPDLPVRNMWTMETQIETHVASERLIALLTGTFAALATTLAAIGLYGVLAFNVTRRTREIGIRMALGAHVRQVRGLVLRETALMLGIGLLAGLAAAALLGTVIRSALYELEPWDPVVYVSATALMGMIALLAAYAPARRASAVDPLIALRTE
jgi:predicted permease